MTMLCIAHELGSGGRSLTVSALRTRGGSSEHVSWGDAAGFLANPPWTRSEPFGPDIVLSGGLHCCIENTLASYPTALNF